MLFKKTIWKQAISNNNESKIREIVSSYIDWSTDKELYRHSINLAIYYRRNELLKFLIENSIEDVLSFDKFAVMPSPMHHAVNYGNCFALELLLNYFGSNSIDRKFEEHENISWTKGCSKTPLELLVDKFDDKYRLSSCGEFDEEEKKKTLFLISNGANIDDKLRGCLVNDYQIVSLMLSKGANPNTREHKHPFGTPLHNCKCNATREILIKFGADQTIRDKNGNTPYDCFEQLRSLPFSSHKENPFST